MPSPANVPYTGETGGSLYQREESIHDNPTPSVRVQGSPAAFGVDIAQATQHLGDVAENAGKELFDRAYAMQELNAHTNAANANVTIQNKVDDAKVQFSQLEGKAAQDAYPAYQAQIDKIRADELAKVSPYEQKLIDADSRSTVGRAKMQGAQYAGTQFKKYQDDTDNATVDAAIRNMSGDPNSTGVNIAKIQGAINSKYDRKGVPVDNPMRIEESRKVVDVAYQAQINAMLRANNPGLAKQTLDAAMKSGALFSNDAMVLAEAVRKANAAKDSIDSGRAGMIGQPTSASPVAPPASFFTDRAAPGHGPIDAQNLQPGFTARLAPLVDAAEKATGEKVQFTSGFRTSAEQAALYNNEPGSGRVGPAAPPGSSMHERGLAVDIASGQARDYIMAHAAEYGLGTIKGDPEHIELARAPNGSGVQVRAIGSADRVAAGGVLGVLINAESRGQNIVSGTDSDSHGLKASQGGNASEISQGYFQIQNHPGGTWATYAAKAGVDLAKYPTPRSAPYDVQWQVAQTIPVDQWGGRTKQMLEAAGYHIQHGETLGQMVARYGGTPPQGLGVTPVDTSTIYHATLTPEDAMDRPLEDKYAQAWAHLQQTNSANDPDAWEATKKYIDGEDARQHREIEDMTRQNMGVIGQAVYGPNAAQVATIPELRKVSPQLAEAIDSVSHYAPEKLETIQRVLDKNAKGDVPETPARLKEYARLKLEATLEPEKFAKEPIWDLDITNQMKRGFIDQQVKNAGKTPSNPDLLAALKQPDIRSQFAELGLFPKDEAYQQLASEISDALEQYVTDNDGKHPDAEERTKAATRIFQMHALGDPDDQGLGGWIRYFNPFGGSSPKEKWKAEREIPDEDGITPSDFELERAWARMEYQKLYEKSGKAATAPATPRPAPPPAAPPASAKFRTLDDSWEKKANEIPLKGLGTSGVPNWGPAHAGSASAPIIPEGSQ